MTPEWRLGSLIGVVLDSCSAADLSPDERHEREGVSFYKLPVPSFEVSIWMLIRGVMVEEGERFVIRTQTNWCDRLCSYRRNTALRAICY